MVDAPNTVGPPATGIFGVGIALGVGDGPGVGVGPNVIVCLQTSGTDENAKLLSRTRQEKLYVPFWDNVYWVESEPGLPTFFSTSFVVPSGKVNSTAVISPSTSVPEQVIVVVNGGVPLEGDRVRPVQLGIELFDVPVGVGVGEGPGVAEGPGVGVGDGPCVGVWDGPVVGVLVAMLNTSWHFCVLTAFGVTCGTVGATDCLFSSCVEVRYATTPITTVRMVTKSRYQYFLKNDICYCHAPSTKTSAAI